MAKKKIYAVRKGHKTGLFNTWAECQKATAGYSGAEFRGFTEKEEALAFLNMETTKTVSGDKSKEAAGVVEVPENMRLAAYSLRLTARKSGSPGVEVIRLELRSEMWQERC